MLSIKYSLTILALLASSFAHAQERTNVNSNSPKNPFTKPSSMVPAIPPSSLPMDANFQINSSKGFSPLPEDTNFDWSNVKIVGTINNYIILRITDNNNSNGNSGGNNSNSNNNNSSNGSSSQNKPKTIFTTFDNKFTINRNTYTIKNNSNKFYTIFNKANQPVHTVTMANSPTQLIPRNSGSSGGSSTGSTPASTSANNGSSNSSQGAGSGQLR